VNEDELAAFLEEGQPRAEAGDDRPPGERARESSLDEATGAEGVRRLLADDATWADVPSGGADALLAAIRAEQPRQGTPPSGAWGGPGSSGRASRVPPRWSRPAQGTGHVPPAGAAGWDTRRRTLVAVAAVALLVLGVLGGMVVRGDDERPHGDQEVALAGSELQPDASGHAELRETGTGVEVWLTVDGLPPAEPGTYYQGWVKGERGSVTIGTFHMREGDDEPVILWSGVELDDYRTITVTLQQEGGGAESSGVVVLSGDVEDVE
jgi:hypothetical protein